MAQNTVVVKFEVDGGECRLARTSLALTMAQCRELLRSKFGARVENAELTYTLPGDPDRISLREDEDLALALELRSFGDQPLKIFCSTTTPWENGGDTLRAGEHQNLWTAHNDVPATDACWAPHDESADTYQQASATLKEYGVEASAQDLELLLKALDFSPRRLVKVNLAHPKSLRQVTTMQTAGQEEEEEEEEEERAATKGVVTATVVSEQQTGLKQPTTTTTTWEEEDHDIVLVGSPEEAHRAVADDDATLGHRLGTNLAELRLDAAARQTSKEEPAESSSSSSSEEEEDAVVRALRRRGLLNPTPLTLHVLLRVLRTSPKRFVKLGLVADIKAARAAYRATSTTAAKLLLKSQLAEKVRLGKCCVVVHHHADGGPKGFGRGKGAKGFKGKGGRGFAKGGFKGAGRGRGGHHHVRLVAYHPHMHRAAFHHHHAPEHAAAQAPPPPPPYEEAPHHHHHHPPPPPYAAADY